MSDRELSRGIPRLAGGAAVGIFMIPKISGSYEYAQDLRGEESAGIGKVINFLGDQGPIIGDIFSGVGEELQKVATDLQGDNTSTVTETPDRPPTIESPDGALYLAELQFAVFIIAAYKFAQGIFNIRGKKG